MAPEEGVEGEDEETEHEPAGEAGGTTEAALPVDAGAIRREIGLKRQVNIVRDEVRRTRKATFSVDGVDEDGGKTGVIADLMEKYDEFQNAARGLTRLVGLEFAHSVTFEFEAEISPTDEARIEALEKKATRVQPSSDEIARAIPSSVVGLIRAERLVAAPSERAIFEARSISARAFNAYKDLAETLVEKDGTLTLNEPDSDDEIVFDAKKAKAALDAEPDEVKLKREKEVVTGVLTRADGDEKIFRVKLDPDLIPQSLGKRRAVVEGPYTDAARKQVENDGLWNKRVLATVSFEPVVFFHRDERKIEEFVFEEVEEGV